MLQVEQVLRVLGHRSHASIEVRALEVRHGMKSLLSNGIFQIPNWEKRNRHHSGSGEADPTLGGECDMHCLPDSGVSLAVGDGSCPRIHRVVGYHHAGLTYI
jgi:hypothetical protein